MLKVFKIVWLCVIIAIAGLYAWFFVDRALLAIAERDPIVIMFCLFAMAYMAGMVAVIAAIKLHKVYHQ